MWGCGMESIACNNIPQAVCQFKLARSSERGNKSITVVGVSVTGSGSASAVM